MADGSIIIDTKIDSTGLDKQLSNLKSSLSNTTDSLNSLTSKALIGFAAIGAAITPAIKLASDLAESANATRVVFGDATSTIEEFGRVAQEQAGLTSAEFNQMAAQIGAGLINAGQSQEEAAKQSVELTKRAADMASIFNTDVSEALTAVQAGLRGESEPLRRFAVGLDEASVSAKAVEMGLAKSVSTVSAYGKSQARLALIMSQSSKFQGDFVNTSDQLANSTRIATAMIKEEAAQAGAQLLPIVLKVIKGFLEWAKEGDRLKNAMQSIAGAIKWATDNGFVQGILAAVAAIVLLNGSMTVLAGLAAMTPLGAIVIAIGAVAGVAVAASIATENYNKQLKINNEESSKNKKAAEAILGPQNELSKSQKVSSEQVTELIRLYPQLNGVLKAGETTLKDAADATAKAAEAQRLLNLELLNSPIRRQIAQETENINQIKKKLKLYEESKGINDAGEANRLRFIADYKAMIEKAEQAVKDLNKELNKNVETSIYGAGGFKPTLKSTPAATPAATPAGGMLDETVKKTVEASSMFGMLQDAIKKTKEILAQPTPQTVFDEFSANIDMALQKTADGAMTWEQYGQTVEAETKKAIDSLYAMGVTIEDQTPGGEWLRSLIDDVNKAAMSPELPKLGTKIVSKLAAGMSQAAHLVQKATRKTMEVVGQVIQEGIKAVSAVSGGFGSVISAIAEFDPKEAYDAVKEFIEGIKDFFKTDLGSIPIFVEDILKEIVKMFDEIDPKKTADIFKNVITAVVKSITTYGPTIITSFMTLLNELIPVFISMLPQIVALGLQLIVALHNGMLANIDVISQTVMSTIIQIIQLIAASLPQILQAATGIALAMTQALIDNLPMVLDAILQIIMVLIDEIVRSAPLFGNMGIRLVIALITGIVGMLPEIVAKIVEMIPLIILGILSAIPTLIIALVTGIISLFFDALTYKRKDNESIGAEMVNGIGVGLENALKDLGKAIEDGWNGFVQGVKDFFGIASPSKMFAEFGTYMAQGIGVGINNTDIFGDVEGGLSDFTGQVGDALSVNPQLKMSADAVNSVMAGLSQNANMALSVAGSAAINASATQAIQIAPAPVILDGMEVSRVVFKHTDKMVRMAYGS